MYSESDLEAAVAGGVLTPAQAAGFRNFIAAGQHAPAVDEEHFRLLTGFNDIFVAIAAAILLAIGAAIAGLGAWLHWRRFKVPITIAVGAAAGVALVLGLIASAFVAPDMNEAATATMKNVLLASSLVLGIGTFLFAMRWD